MNITLELFFPLVSYALTSGPSQPEVQSFEPVGTTEMVDLFTGDYTYNIPLFELPGPNGGYPFNLHYNSGISMDQESSWVGLGWNLNPGVINRSMRGFPDEFKGDIINREQDIRDNITFGGAFGGNLEVFGADFSKGIAGNPSLSLGIGIYYNNYKGVGYSLDMGLSGHTGAKDGMSAGLGLNLSLDSQEGIGVNPSLSLTSHGENNKNTFTMGTGYNSRRGLTGSSMGFTATSSDRMNKDRSIVGGTKGIGAGTKSIGGTSRISFANQSYSPQVSMPMQGRNVSLTVKLGGAVFGIFGNAYINGHFSTQYLKDKNTNARAYGYMHLQNAGTGDLMDFNREKDGMVMSNTPNLAVPGMTYDVYSVAGQGIGGMYRAYRSDVGVLHDQQMTSLTFGGAGGFETGLGMPHIGGDLSINYAETSSGKWEGENQTKDLYRFVPATDATVISNKIYEPYYFKTHGEHTSDNTGELAYIGNSEPVRVVLEEGGSFLNKKFIAKKSLKGKSGNITNEPLLSNTNSTESREPRNLVVQPISNADITDNSNNEILKEYKVKYFTATDSINNYKSITKDSIRRGTKQQHHTGGITAVNPDGSRYVYALPAYNNKQVECQFSVKPAANSCAQVVEIDKTTTESTKPTYKSSDYNGTDKYYNKTTMPGYAHSYLLTSILGADYIDADSIDGPSVGDLGYWVKFNYVKAVETYKWRVPFNGANYMKGYQNNTPIGDDKGAYTYGEKEIWHLATVESKSHVAAFSISKRQDGTGAMRELQNAADATRHGASSYKLDKISLYSRSTYESSGNPIRNVHFEYNYDLCGNVYNNRGQTITVNGTNINANKGKLTLKKVWFTDENNDRGSLSPYQFNYNERTGGGTINLSENPNYHTHKYDRWGNYKPYEAVSDSMCINMAFPYVEQFSSVEGFKDNLDKNMAVWNLKSIILPSGGKIEINYEADDYAYVQNKTAMQMMKIASLASGSTTDTISHPADDNGSGGANRRIYFQLEKVIPNSLSASDRKKEVEKYIDPSRKLYYKVYINLLKPSQTNIREYVSGYADVADFNVDANSLFEGNYTKAYVELARMRIGGKTMKYHPFSHAAWQHMRTAQPDLANIGNYPGDPNTKESQKQQKIGSLVNVLEDVKKVFKGYYKYAYNNDWGEIIDLNKSFIRLNTPDKIKYGGGVRVKEIILRDNWNSSTSETGNVYGQVYSYSMEEDGNTISSGVAAYEPMIGGDEIALRRARGFTEEIPLMTPNNLFFEYPVNENYYPAPTVGYRRVEVKSIATNYTGIAGTADPYDIPSGIMTTGATVHEFYTAKDFPVITNETEIDKKPFNLVIPIPLLGQITADHMTASQGYSIELNDMHGKLKKISNYKHDSNGNLLPEADSYVKYNYQTTNVFNNSGRRGEDYMVLNNRVETLIADNGVAQKEFRNVGQDYEFFTDMRQSRTFSAQGGLNLNTEIIFIPFPLPAFVPWPNISTSTTQVRTAVTNKIIHRSGILKSIEAYDGGSMVKTENKLFDALTGQPVLTTVTNNFDEPIYNYNLPAHLVYDGMGPAYKNIGLSFTATLSAGTGTNNYNADTTNLPWKHLVPGDEFVITDRKGVFIERKENNLVFNIEGSSYTGSKQFLLVRSGRRNHLSVNAGNVTALNDPTANRLSDSCAVSIKIPEEVPDVYKREITGCARQMIAGINNLVRAVNNGTYKYSDCPDTAIWQPMEVARSLNGAVSGGPYAYSQITPIDNSCSASCFNNHTVLIDDRRSANIFFRPIWGSDDVNYTYYAGCPPAQSYRSQSSCNGNTQVYLISFYTLDNGVKNDIQDKSSILSISDPYIDYQYSYNGNTWDNQEAHGVAVNIEMNTLNGIVVKKAYVQSNTGETFRFQWKTVPGTQQILTFSDFNFQSDKNKIDKVLNSSAINFSDNWPLDNSVLRGDFWTSTNRNNFSDKNSFVKGTEGVWRSGESYTYVDNRKQSTGINIKTDGSFDAMPLFDWNNPAFCDSKWRKVNTITDYSPYTYEIENKDILGNYSAALFGYKGDLATAVASNARNSEIAFEGFEELIPDQAVGQTNYGAGNLHVFTSAISETINTYNTYKIVAANKNYLIIDRPFNPNLDLSSAEIDGTIFSPSASLGTKIKGNYAIIEQEAYPDNSSYTVITLDPAQFTLTSKWIGSGKFKLSTSSTIPTVTFGGTGAERSISSAIAHTGKNSFKVKGTAEYEQRNLNLIPGKKYVYSSWVSGNSNSGSFGMVSGYTGISARIRFKNSNGTILTTTYTFPVSGSVINGWQKLEGEFTVPTDAVSVLVEFNSGSSSGNYLTAYVDDIRIHPLTSNMQTYVYNNTNYRLAAILDNNNYATLYYYDAKGNLFLLKKETERGIQTIQESFSHQKEN